METFNLNSNADLFLLALKEGLIFLIPILADKHAPNAINVVTCFDN